MGLLHNVIVILVAYVHVTRYVHTYAGQVCIHTYIHVCDQM